MRLIQWTAWPSREALCPEGRGAAHRTLSGILRLLIAAAVLWEIAVDNPVSSLRLGVQVLGLAVAVAATWGYFRMTAKQRLWASLGLFGVLLAEAFAALALSFHFAATVLWCGLAIIAIERLPLALAVPLTAGCLTTYASSTSHHALPATALTALFVVLVGYAARLEAETRAGAQRLLAQERAARSAEAESAALRERGRIAREIHDVLAHSLSAQAVRLEAARLLIESGAEPSQVLDLVVAARRTARQGLVETRQALLALRGELTPVEDFLRELADGEGARLHVEGRCRQLSAEVGLAVRRVAQEAVTNVRKHAPGAHVAVRLVYGPAEVALEIRDLGCPHAGKPSADHRASGDRPAHGPAVDNASRSTGAGYGLLGMRERAELLGGTLDAGPAQEGFVVRLWIPA